METRRDTTVEAIALLPLPDLTRLSEQQINGTICVWDGATLGPTAIDLGQRRVGQRTAFPRACRTCMSAKAQEAAEQHADMCESCVDIPLADNAPTCYTARALRRLILEHSR